MINESLSFDFEQYKALGEELLASAKTISKEAAAKLLEYQQKVMDLGQRAATGQLDPNTAKLAATEYGRAVKMVMHQVAEKLSWEVVDKYRKATDSLLSWLSLFPMELIKRA